MSVDYIESNLVDELTMLLSSELATSSQVVIVTDENVAQHHLVLLKSALKDISYSVLIIAPGEQSKSREVKAHLETELLKLGCDRKTLLLAFGGGVVSDLTGFVAATYMRGIRYINIPTTLLAMVDSSVGGKTAINVAEGKNLIGAFWQPSQVVIDVSLLSTLPEAHIVAGVVEALKMFVCMDADASTKCFDMLQVDNDERVRIPPKLEAVAKQSLKKLFDVNMLKWLVKASIDLKSKIVEEDERENELRKILNFGHTAGHAIEKLSDYQMLHGIAVGYGILLESKIAELAQILKAQDYQLIKNTLAKLNIKPDYLLQQDKTKLIQAMQGDKKNVSGAIYCVLLSAIGQVHYSEGRYAHPVSIDDIDKALAAIAAEEGTHER